MRGFSRIGENTTSRSPLAGSGIPVTQRRNALEEGIDRFLTFCAAPFRRNLLKRDSRSVDADEAAVVDDQRCRRHVPVDAHRLARVPARTPDIAGHPVRSLDEQQPFLVEERALARLRVDDHRGHARGGCPTVPG